MAAIIFMGNPNGSGGTSPGSMPLVITPRGVSVAPSGTQQYTASAGTTASTISITPKGASVAPSATQQYTATG